MRKTNKTLKVTRGIVLLLCCIIFFSSFSVVYALGLGKHNNIFENLNDTVAASKQDTYPYSRLTAVKSGDVVIEEALSSDKISSVGMDVLYGTTHGLVMYYGEVPYKETWNKDKRVSGWEGYAYQKDTTLSNTDYWGNTGISKDEVSVEDLENVNSTDKIVSLRLYALSKSPVAFQFWFRNIGYIIQSFFANLGTKIVSLLVAAKNIDMSDIVNALGLSELSKVVNKAFIWNSDGTGGGHLSIFTVFCLLMFIVSIVGYGISYARGTKKTKDIKDILLPAFAGIIIIGMCLTGRIETLGSSLSNAVSKVVYSIAGIATDSNGGAIFITSVDDPKYENKVVQIQEMSLINKCLIDMQIDAHIPESYIGNIPQRLAIYRRIADIYTNEDALDVKDELEDRYGAIPPSVQGLIDISLLRNSASKLGIYEIGQKGQSIILYLNEIPTGIVLNLSSQLRGRVSVSDFGKKYIAVKMTAMQNPLDTLKEVFGYIGN